jgi:hypothetical protein
MKNLTFVGTDCNLETSLLEYGLIVAHVTKDYQDEYFTVYRSPYSEQPMFGTGYVRESELDSLIDGNEWMSADDVTEFLSFTGCSDAAEFKALPFIQKISDLISYYGTENVIGTDYYPITEEEAITLYLS